jgi:hypothetical protein
MGSWRCDPCLFLCLVAAVGGTVNSVFVGYHVTQYNSSQGAPPVGHWAKYDDEAHLGTVSSASEFDDTLLLDSLGISVPFFGLEPRPLFVDSNGFLSFLPYAMCSSFCQDTATGFYAYVQQSSQGGDWPIIGPYIGDLDPTNDREATIYKRVDESNGSTIALVEYRSVKQYTDPSAESETAGATFQVQVWSNGTIIFRYKSVIDHFLNEIAPNVAIVLTDGQRLQLPTPKMGAQRPDILAFRLDPERDTCAQFEGCASCIASNCSWCNTTSTCRHSLVARSYCPPADLIASGDSCETQPVRGADVQQFYSQTLVPSTPEFDILQNIPSTVPRVSALLTKAQFPFEITLPFSFRFFDFPIDGAGIRVVNRVYLHSTGALTTEAASGDCSVADGSCGRYAMLPFVSTLFEVVGDHAAVATATLDKRSIGDPFCTVELTDAGQCARGVVIELENIRPTFDPAVVQPIGAFAQLLISSDGRLAMRVALLGAADAYRAVFFNASTPIRFHPSVMTGVARFSPSDFSSSLVPETYATVGATAVFTPITGCADCQGRGECDIGTMQCRCDNATTGVGCNECRPEHFGANCARCPECNNGGSCDWGKNATGRCVCSDPWSGSACDVRCEDTDPRPLNCPKCSSIGGICLCGRCTCKKDFGWSGENCDVWNDPCSKFSLDGCAACVTAEFPCVYCGASDYKCVSERSNSNIPKTNETKCQVESLTRAGIDRCPLYKYPYGSRDATGPSLFVIVAVFLGLGFLICVGVFVLWCCRVLPPNPLIINAVTGIPAFRHPRREREMVHVAPCRHIPGLVQAIPMKQLSLNDLYTIKKSDGSAH